MNIGQRVTFNELNEFPDNLPMQGTVASVPNDFDPFVIVELDKGQWTEGQRMYVRFAVAHPDNLETIA